MCRELLGGAGPEHALLLVPNRVLRLCSSRQRLVLKHACAPDRSSQLIRELRPRDRFRKVAFKPKALSDLGDVEIFSGFRERKGPFNRGDVGDHVAAPMH